jgi:hypothetical protein
MSKNIYWIFAIEKYFNDHFLEKKIQTHDL